MFNNILLLFPIDKPTMSLEENSEVEDIAPFKLLVDKGIGNDVLEAKWCPTMDLLGFINSKNEILVQRAGSGSSWARLLTLTGSSSTKPICISWRIPDGEFLGINRIIANIQFFYTNLIRKSNCMCLRRWINITL